MYKSGLPSWPVPKGLRKNWNFVTLDKCLKLEEIFQLKQDGHFKVKKSSFRTPKTRFCADQVMKGKTGPGVIIETRRVIIV